MQSANAHTRLHCRSPNAKRLQMQRRAAAKPHTMWCAVLVLLLLFRCCWWWWCNASTRANNKFYMLRAQERPRGFGAILSKRATPKCVYSSWHSATKLYWGAHTFSAAARTPLIILGLARARLNVCTTMRRARGVVSVCAVSVNKEDKRMFKKTYGSER